MKKTKDLFIEQRIWEERLELPPIEEEFICSNYVQNNKRRIGSVLEPSIEKNRHKRVC